MLKNMTISRQIKLDKITKCEYLLKTKQVFLFYEYMFSCERANKLVHYHHKFLSNCHGKKKYSPSDIYINLNPEQFKRLKPLAIRCRMYKETLRKKTVDRYNDRIRKEPHI